MDITKRLSHNLAKGISKGSGIIAIIKKAGSGYIQQNSSRQLSKIKNAFGGEG